MILAAAVPAPAPAAAAPARACATPDFRDVRGGSTFYEHITWLRCERISVGYAAGTYAPGQPITRGEAAQLLYRFSGERHSPGTRKDFTDVPVASSAFTAVSWMQEQGHTNGYSDGTFGVAKPIARGEVAAFMFRMSGADDQVPMGGPSVFPDMETSDTFYRAAHWFHQAQLASGYADGTFRPARDVTRGETAKLLYGLQTHLNGKPPAYQVPVSAPSTGLAANPTGGTGGVYRDARSLTYGNGAVGSQYHLYADHLDGATPHGIMIHLHGDGGFEYDRPEWSTVPAYTELARKHRLMLVVPRTPDTATTTWWRRDSSGQYAADLLSHLGKRYNLDLNRVYWTGYSGGADTVARHMVNSHSAGWTGGGAVIVAGGGIYGQRAPLRPISASLMKNFQMHWVVGADDTPSAGGSSGSFDAVGAARLGHAFYSGLGMKTSLTVKPGMDHWEIASSGPAKLAEVLAGR